MEVEKDPDPQGRAALAKALGKQPSDKAFAAQVTPMEIEAASGGGRSTMNYNSSQPRVGIENVD